MSEDDGPLTYRSAGVDIDAADRLVQALGPLAARTARPGADGSLGGFGALFDLQAAGYRRPPVLVAATDGVGTKLRVALATGRHLGIGQDLVAMCVNDLAVQAAEPLFFLDYYATGKLDGAVAEAVVEGIAEGCRYAGCALVGGETAEMPGHYAGGDYDLAGFAVGAAARHQLLPRPDLLAAGDVLLGLPSHGLHANGFSLVRKVLARTGRDYGEPAPFDPASTLGEALLVPTAIYSGAARVARDTGAIKAMAHITGGGLVDNIPRVLPAELGARLDARQWELPPEMAWLRGQAQLSTGELARTFNCGLGLVLAVAPEAEATVWRALEGAGESPHRVGVLEPRGDTPVAIDGTEAAWG